MRKLKIFLWILIVFLIQTVVISHLHIFAAVPSFVMAYMTGIVIMENEYRNAMIISVICAFAMGALSGREFISTTLSYFFSAVIVFTFRKKPEYVSDYFKTAAWTFIMSAVTETAYFAVVMWTVNIGTLLYDALPTAVLNTAFAIVIYPVLKKTMYKEEKKKLLIV